MVLQFATFPVGPDAGESLSPVVAESLKIIDGSGLEYQFTSMGTIVEGEWDELMDIVKKCHQNIGSKFSRVYTVITIDDRKGAENRLAGKVSSVEEKAGRSFKK